MSRVQQVKQDWNRFIERLRNFLSRNFKLDPNHDDSVESKAETLRIWMWASAAGLAIIVVATVVTRTSVEPDADRKSQLVDVPIANQLPSGFVLVPIEPTNLDSLDSIFGQHGYADLYRAAGDRQKGRRLARGVALIRSPKNPRRFAALVPESSSPGDSQKLSELSEPVLVILRRGPAISEENAEATVPGLSRKRATKKIDLIEEASPEPLQMNPAGDST